MQNYRGLFQSPPILDTPRLTLRPVTLKDERDMYRCCCDPEVSRHVLWDTHQSMRDTRATIRSILKDYRAGVPASLAIVRKSDHRMIGTMGFMCVDCDNRCGEVGYSIARDCWNQGYATEALTALLHYGFDTLRLNRIEAMFETDNPASGRVMEKCGMRMEGIMRQRVFNKGHYSDVYLYSVLRGDNTVPQRNLL